MSDDIGQVTRTFVESMPGKVREVQRALEEVVQQLGTRGEADWKQLHLLAHRLAGACGTYGFDELSELARHLEDGIQLKCLQGMDPKTAAVFLQRWYAAFANRAREAFDRKAA
jgi:HPt (histidine-containing phosphotransfer) domain-containing protein